MLTRCGATQIVFNPNGGESSATDGDMDAAFALFLAAAFWEEPVYHAAAVRICAALYACCFNKDTQVPRHRADALCCRAQGDGVIACRRWTCVITVTNVHAEQESAAPFSPCRSWSTCSSQLGAVIQVSTPGDFATPKSRLYSISRPSDYMLTHLKRFAEEDADRGTQWAAVLESTVQVRMAGDLPSESVVMLRSSCPSEPQARTACTKFASLRSLVLRHVCVHALHPITTAAVLAVQLFGAAARILGWN